MTSNSRTINLTKPEYRTLIMSSSDWQILAEDPTVVADTDWYNLFRQFHSVCEAPEYFAEYFKAETPDIILAIKIQTSFVDRTNKKKKHHKKYQFFTVIFEDAKWMIRHKIIQVFLYSKPYTSNLKTADLQFDTMASIQKDFAKISSNDDQKLLELDTPFVLFP